MLSRYITAIATATAVTASLIWVMHTLIEVSQAAAGTPVKLPNLVYTPQVHDTPITPKALRPEPIDAPPITPPIRPITDRANDGGSIPLRSQPPHRPDGPTRTILGGPADNGLFNIIHARPDYPIRAQQKGLEGYVIVQFDVNVAGGVENVLVVESSSTIFDRAAIKAAYRSRYKPQTVDGMPQRTTGIRKLYRFEMEI